MWDALDIGSAPIQVLEPGCGTGNFMAGIPENIKANVSGVELDPISARIAAALNPDATILNADLADCTIHPGFDLTIGNVPYSGDISLDYRTTDGGTSRLPLHDYFIERSVDALRPGGVAMLLTSRYTLDKRSETMRADLARKAELVGAVRLPSSTFARQAGTEAVTDVLVLRRRERTLDRTPDEAWIHSNPVAVPGYQDVTVNVNQAVANDMTAHAVGDIRPVIGRFGGDFDVVFQGDAEQVGERLQELLSTQITHGPALSLGEAEPAGRAEITVRPDHVAPFEYSVDQRGVVWYGDGTTVTEIAHGQGDEARRLRGMIRLRDLARELQRLELDPARVDDPDVEAKRAELDRAYDRFTSEFGRLCDRANQRAYSGEESGCHLVMALEETDEKGRFAGKAKCLSQRTISPVPPMPDHADSLDDALDISLDRAGGVDLELIARLADTTVEEAETGLGDRIIRDPDTGEVMPAEDYLAGDVGTKLDHVTAMAEHLRRRAAREAMTEFAASTYATSEDMPAIEQAREWIDTAGTDVWRSLTDPYAAESYRDPTPVIERINDGRHGWTMGWNRNPELVLALVWRAVEELPERHSRVTLERSDTGERKPWHAPAWHRSHGTSPLWDALCWTWRDGDAPQHYAPILADRRMPVRDLALFVHKIAHTDRLETADKTAILSNLFESYSAHDKHGSTIWTDTTIGAMVRRLMPGTDRQKKEMEELSDRADLVRDGDVPPEVDNLLRITGDGRKIALDPKLLKGHENDRPLENGKIQACAENVARIWQEETPRLGTQLIFCDSSTPASGGWNAYQDLKDRLIQLGVPAEQIAFVHDAGDNPARREQLFAKVRSGEIRVLMGSTQKLGTGTNVQERLAAIHDLDCPWRPADLEQRLGRIQRQGNTYDHVRDYRYVTEGTFDAYSYQTVERKQRFISQLMSSKSPAREAADLDADVVTLANIKALATGDPDIQRRMTLENEINQLKLLRASWAQQKADTRRDINQQLQPRIEGIRQAIREKTDDKPLASKALNIHQTARMNGKWEGMTINGRPVGDRQTACRLLHQAAHQAHDGDTIAEYDGLPVIARRAATTGRITLAVKAVHEHESGTEMPGPYLTGPSSIVSQLDRIVKNMATDPGKLTERLADAERELAAAQETLAEPFAHEDEYRQKQAELERLTSKPDEPRETESRDQETKERSAGMPLTTENARRLLEQDHDVTEVTQGGNAMGHYLEARLTDGRAVQIDFHDNPAWKDTDRLAGRIEVSYANRPQAEWQYDDNDMADREHTVIDPADPAAGKTLAKAVEGWERAGGLHTARAAGTSHLAANQPPEEYAYRWRKPGDPDRHIAYLSTAFDRDQAMKARENAGYVVTKVDEDPAVLYEQHRKASCMRASHILERYESPDQDAVRILHGIVGEVNAHDPENDIATYLAYPSDKVVQIAGDGLTSADIAEKREMGGWDPRKDPLMRINAQGDWTGITQQQADQIVWDNRDEILTRASYDSELSTWTLHQLDQLKEPQPTQSLDRDRPEPDHKAPAQADSTTKRHGPRL